MNAIQRLLEKDDDKLSQQAVLYMPPESINKAGSDSGARCGKCAMFNRSTSRCRITEPSLCNAQHGVCGLYVGGEYLGGEPERLVSKEVAGYIEKAPTHCGNCEYFLGPDQCKHVQGPVDANGCCNGWDGDGSSRESESSES